MPERPEPDYQALAGFRHLVRRFMVFSEQAARQEGLQPQQHQLLLAVKGLRPDGLPTIGALAWQLQLKHHSVVELVDRLSRLGMVQRNTNALDHREVLIEITPKGEAVLRRLSLSHHDELRRVAPLLMPALQEFFRVPMDPPSVSSKEPTPCPTPLQPSLPRPGKRRGAPRSSATSRPRRGSSRSASSPSSSER